MYQVTNKLDASLLSILDEQDEMLEDVEVIVEKIDAEQVYVVEHVLDEQLVEITDEVELDEWHIGATHQTHIIIIIVEIIDVQPLNMLEVIEVIDELDTVHLDIIWVLDEVEDEVDIEYVVEVIDEIDDVEIEIEVMDEIDEDEVFDGIGEVTDELVDGEVVDRADETDEEVETVIGEMLDTDEQLEKVILEQLILYDKTDMDEEVETHTFEIEVIEVMMLIEATELLWWLDVVDALCLVMLEEVEMELVILDDLDVIEHLDEVHLVECID